MNPLSTLQQSLIAKLADAVPASILLTGTEELERYSCDISGIRHARPLLVARPGSTGELSRLMGSCHRHDIQVVPQGGLTGLVGAAVASHPAGEIVVSLERMDRVRSVDAIDYAMVVEAGCVLERAKAAADAAGCLLPITLGSQGSCRIGGNIATNAGGFNVLRYGMTRDLVLGLEAVLPDGRVWDGLRVLRKDNRGYDLKQLFIGSEGTLGIVTAAALKVFPRPDQVETAFLALGSIEAALELYSRARRECSDLISAFELILRPGLEVALNSRADLRDPLGDRHPVYVLAELSAAGRIDLRGLLEGFLADAGDIVQDGVIASSRAQAERLWLLREVMVDRQGRGGPYLRSDVSVPISRLAAFVADALSALALSHPDATPITYGHVGDGNLHLNVIPPQGMNPNEMAQMIHEAEEVLFEVLDRHGGSISAEHGIGTVKQQAYLSRVDPVTLELSRRIKDAFDPRHLLSDGRIFNR
ncbi:FAD-binding oxidoreductase [Paracoccus ravus]|uniref:FAD-binding oxidoreductase n=1 Tax=Paracoccus ravus TaxID=2447760 RepID=UPI00106E8D1F|nr:FAD-binding oxidoreductase [Paracoccus ravus]